MSTMEQCREILNDYANKDSTVDAGNLFYIACFFLAEIDRMKAEAGGVYDLRTKLEDARETLAKWTHEVKDGFFTVTEIHPLAKSCLARTEP